MSPKPGQAGAEIDVTPEMVEAGVDVLLDQDPEHGIDVWFTARAVFDAMMRARLEPPPQDGLCRLRSRLLGGRTLGVLEL